MKKETIGILITILLVLFSFGLAVLPTYLYPSVDPQIPADLDQNILLGNTREGTNPGADVEMIVFEDFKCTHCREFQDTLLRIMVVYGDKVNIVIRHYPKLEGSRFPALASECAREQGKFWGYHNRLYKSDSALGPDDLLLIANDAGLDLNRFSDCMNTERTAGVIAEDLEIASEKIVRGTPTTFINGRLIEGDAGYARFKKLIDEELR